MDSPAVKRVKRTDNERFHKSAHDNELTLKRIVDKRWGKQPVQSKIDIRKAQQMPSKADPDEDIDDK